MVLIFFPSEFLINEIQRIIDKWGNYNDGKSFIFPFLKGGETSEEIKSKSHDVFTRINKRMKAICQDLGISKITTYSARHSFATILSHEGVPISYISQQLGHTSIRTTQAYLGSFEKDTRIQNSRILTSFLND